MRDYFDAICVAQTLKTHFNLDVLEIRPQAKFAKGKPQPKASLQLAFVFAVAVLIANASKTHGALFSALCLAKGNNKPYHS